MTPPRPDIRDLAKPQQAPDAIRWFDEAGFAELAREATAYELVRVTVPKDHVGVVTVFWQWLASPLGALTGPLDHLTLGPGVTVSWALAVEDKSDSIPKTLRSIPHPAPEDLPSGRVPPFGTFSDLRHPWGLAAPVRLFVQERSTLSVWVTAAAPVGELRQAGARLGGYTQLGRSQHTYENLVRGP